MHHISVIIIRPGQLHTLKEQGYDEATIYGSNKKYCIVFDFSFMNQNRVVLDQKPLYPRLMATASNAPKYFRSIEQAFQYLEQHNLYPRMDVNLSRGGEIVSN